jgi:hypothetical protein
MAAKVSHILSISLGTKLVRYFTSCMLVIGRANLAIARALLGLSARVTFITGRCRSPWSVNLVKDSDCGADVGRRAGRARYVDVGVFARQPARWRIANASDQRNQKDDRVWATVTQFRQQPR